MKHFKAKKMLLLEAKTTSEMLHCRKDLVLDKKLVSGWFPVSSQENKELCQVKEKFGLGPRIVGYIYISKCISVRSINIARLAASEN